MPTGLDYESKEDQRHVEPPLPMASWLALLGGMVTLATLGKAILVSDGILPDEKPVFILMCVVSAGLNVAALAVNVRRQADTVAVISGFALFVLGFAILVALDRWR